LDPIVSPHTQTLELPVPVLDNPAYDDAADGGHDALAEAFGVESSHDHAYDSEPTTMSIPIAGGMESVVVDESITAERSLESLTITPRRAKLALAALAIAAFAMGANEAAVVALSPQIASGLGVPVATIGILATAFALTIVVATLPLTMLTARFGRRVTLTSTLGIWSVGVVLAATAGSVAHLASGRIVSAAAHALFWAIVAPTAASLFAPHLRGRTVTRIMVGAAAAGVVGTPIVTVVGKNVDWHAPFWGLAVIGVALTVAMALLLPSKPRVEGDDSPAATAPVTRGDLPSKSGFFRVLAVAFLASTGMSGTWTYIVPFYTDQAQITSNSVPVMFALGGVLGVAATLGAAPFLARRAVRTVAVGILTLMAGWSLLGLAQTWSAIAGQVVISTGWAILVAALLNWAMRHTPWSTEVGAGTYTMTMNAGASVGPLLGAAIVARFGMGWLPIVSLVLTFAAAVVTAGADKQMRRRLHVPRRIRMAMAEREALRARRREWRKRSHATIESPKWTARSATLAGRDAVKRAGAGATRAVKRKPPSDTRGRPGQRAGQGSDSGPRPGPSRPTRQHRDSDAEW
jgi:DHA1 family inner membrane transport protein